MSDPHPNITRLESIDIMNIDACADAFTDDVVFRYFNPQLPKLAGDHVGREGIKSFFAKLGEVSKGTFSVRPVNAWPVGNELLVVQTQNTLTLDDEKIVTDVVLVWRFVDGKVAEIWDIPSLFTDAVPLPATSTRAG